jgi:hypothetical protein
MFGRTGMNPIESKAPFTPLEKDILSESFLDMQKMIFKVVWKHYGRYCGDLDELMSEAQERFLYAHTHHDESKGELSTYVYHTVKYGLLEYERKRKNKRRKCSVVSLEDLKTRDASQLEVSKKEPDLTSLLFQVGEDCKNIIYLIIYPPYDFCDEMNEYRKPSEWKDCIQEYLHFRMKWSLQRITMAFTELKEALTEK